MIGGGGGARREEYGAGPVTDDLRGRGVNRDVRGDAEAEIDGDVVRAEYWK